MLCGAVFGWYNKPGNKQKENVHGLCPSASAYRIQPAGRCQPHRPLVSRLKELGFTHAAITDHGVMYGAVDFYNACRDAGITPVIGCEVYICRNRFEKSGAAGNTAI